MYQKTRAILINSPNNPTGVVYPEKDLQRLGEILREKSKKYSKNISLISDEPYRKIVFDDIKIASIFSAYEESIVVYSYSKDLALPGERIGYVAVSPKTEERELLQAGMAISLRTLGFVNAPALMQRLIPLIGDTIVDLEPYKQNREILYNYLTEIGFQCVKPQGAFYLFPKCPIEDDVEFVKSAQEFNLLLVPGSGFGKKGYFRIAYCFDTSMVKRSLPVFKKLIKKYS